MCFWDSSKLCDSIRLKSSFSMLFSLDPVSRDLFPDTEFIREDLSASHGVCCGGIGYLCFPSVVNKWSLISHSKSRVSYFTSNPESHISLQIQSRTPHSKSRIAYFIPNLESHTHSKSRVAYLTSNPQSPIFHSKSRVPYFTPNPDSYISLQFQNRMLHSKFRVVYLTLCVVVTFCRAKMCSESVIFVIGLHLSIYFQLLHFILSFTFSCVVCYVYPERWVTWNWSLISM